MAGRLGVGGLPALTRRAWAARAVRQIHLSSHPLPTGGLQRASAGLELRAAHRRSWLFSGNSYHNAVVAARNVSFARALPKLVVKFVRIPALFGGLMLGGVAWVQYQAVQVSNSAQELFASLKSTVTSTAGGIWDGAMDAADQTRKGWDKKTGEARDSAWMATIRQLYEGVGLGKGGGGGDGDGGHGGRGSGGGSEPPKYSRVGGAAAGVASAAAYGFDSVEVDDRTAEEMARDDQMMVLTKKMIEIRNILQKVGQSSTVTLPSIVVIGSQSSGKSSVLEAIVGHEFLPKGTNMVTRRPIELTLINTPEAKADYGEFPDLGLGRITDFTSVQRTLTDLNTAVPEAQCVSDDPIRLTICSPNVPDLSLIDLPGYIQVVGQNQPPLLKQRIAELCDKYIQPPNIILAISAADVDLANSHALQASRRVDPRGERTIGVITKMDLVDALRGAALLADKQYPLRLGYVGVVSKVPSAGPTLFKPRDGGNLLAAVSRNEQAYFSSHPLEFGAGAAVSVGTITLRKRLMHVLEQKMSASLQSTANAIQQELEEATYEFKVQYNERPLSAESYLNESLDAFKHSFREFQASFGRPQMLELLKNELDQRVLDQLAARYWNKPVADLSPPPPEPDSIHDLPRADPDSPYWHRQLDASVSALTKLGVGRVATTVVAAAIQAHIDRLVDGSIFAGHPTARQAISSAASNILNDRFYSTSDQVENCIKPFKHEVDVEEAEWAKGREHVVGVLKTELDQCQAATKNLEKTVGGRRKLNEVMTFVEKARRGELVVDGAEGAAGGMGGFSAGLIARGREAVFLRDRADTIRMRMLAIQSRQCKTIKNKYHCPEAFLDAVATKLAQTSVLFLNVELLSEFNYQFPRELDTRLGGRHLSDAQMEALASENPRVARHLDVIRRKELLQLVIDKIDSLRRLDAATGGGGGGGGGGKGEGKGGEGDGGGKKGGGKGSDKGGRWGIF